MAEKKSEKLIRMQHAYSAPQSNKRGSWNNGAYLELVRIGHLGPQSGRHYLVFQQLLCNYVIITTITINFPACYYESRCTLTHLTFILAALKNVTKINDNAGPARHDFISKGFTIRVVYFTYIYDEKIVCV